MCCHINKLEELLKTFKSPVNRTIAKAPSNAKEKHVIRLGSAAKQKEESKTRAMEPRNNNGENRKTATRYMTFRE